MFLCECEGYMSLIHIDLQCARKPAGQVDHLVYESFEKAVICGVVLFFILLVMKYRPTALLSHQSLSVFTTQLKYGKKNSELI